MKKILLFITFCLIFSLKAVDISALRNVMPDNKVHGYYAWVDENGILKVNLKSLRDPEKKRIFWENHKKEVNEGKRKYVIFEIIFDKMVKGRRLPAIEDVEEQFKVLFESSPGVQTYPELVYAVVASEENVGRDVPVLNHIYDTVKKKWNVPVFQWLSEPLPPDSRLKADGWVYDAYGKKGEDFYRHTQKFVLTGTPVYPIIWAAEAGLDGYYKAGWNVIKKNAEEKFAICQDLDLPVFLFAVCKKHGSVNCYRSNKAPFPEMRKFFDGLFSKKFAAPVLSYPENIFIIPAGGVFKYFCKFDNSGFVDRVLIKNTRNLKLSNDGLKFKGAATVGYRFDSPDKLKEIGVTLNFAGNIEVGISFDGKKYQFKKAENNRKLSFPAAETGKFYMTIKSDNADLKTLSLEVVGTPSAEKQLTVSADSQGKYFYQERLQQNLFLSTINTTSDMKNLSIRPGNISIFGKKGSSTTWEASQKIVFNGTPVKNIILQVPCHANKSSWNAYVTFGISADGKNPVWKTSDHSKRNQTVTVEFYSEKPLNQCYLHFKLYNFSGVFKQNVAPAGFSGYVLKADADKIPPKKAVSAVPPVEKQLTVQPDSQGKYSYKEQLKGKQFLETVTTASDMKNLFITPGNIGILGKKGASSAWVATQKIVFKGSPVKNINLSVPCLANKSSWNAYVMFGISADGKNPVWKISDHSKRNQTVTVEFSSEKPLSQCYLHFKLYNGSGVFRKNLAPAAFYGYNLKAE